MGFDVDEEWERGERDRDEIATHVQPSLSSLPTLHYSLNTTTEKHGLAAKDAKRRDKKNGGHRRRAQTPASTRARPIASSIKYQRRAQTADGGMRRERRKKKGPSSVTFAAAGSSSLAAGRPATREGYRRVAQDLWTASHVGPSTTHTNNLHCARLLARLPGQIASSQTTEIETTQKNMYGFERDRGFHRAQLLWNGLNPSKASKPTRPKKSRRKKQGKGGGPPARRVVPALMTRHFEDQRR